MKKKAGSSSSFASFSMNHVQIALQILPLSPEEEEDKKLIKISENQVILANIPFSLSQVFDETNNDYLFDRFPRFVVSQLLQGNDASMVIYDTATTNRFDTVLLLEGLADTLFNLKDDHEQVYIQFIEYPEEQGNDTIDLIGQGRHEINIVDDILSYYNFGSDQRTNGKPAATIFSIGLDQKAQFNLLDLSQCSQTTLNLFADLCCINSNASSIRPLQPPLMFKSLQNSSLLLFIACVSHQDDISQLETTLSYVSNMYEKTISTTTSNVYKNNETNKRSSLTTKHNSKLLQHVEDDSEYLRRIILKLTNEVNTLRYQRNRVLSTSSTSTTSDARHASIFSSISNSTSMTIPEEDLPPPESDLKRQVEELENQVTVTRERNTHVERELVRYDEIQDKQSLLIDGLEYKLQEMQQLNHDLYEKLLKETKTTVTMGKELDSMQRMITYLGNEKHQLEQAFSVVETMIFKGNQITDSALQEVISVKIQFDQELEKKDQEIEALTQGSSTNHSPHKELDVTQSQQHNNNNVDKLQHAFAMQAAKSHTLEKRVADLEQELESNQRMIRQGDISGFVEQLELKIQRLEQEKATDEQDFETSYEEALNEMQQLKNKLNEVNEQLDEMTKAYLQKEQELLQLKKGKCAQSCTHTNRGGGLANDQKSEKEEEGPLDTRVNVERNSFPLPPKRRSGALILPTKSDLRRTSTLLSSDVLSTPAPAPAPPTNPLPPVPLALPFNSTSPLPSSQQQQRVVIPPTRNSSRRSRIKHNNATTENNTMQKQLEVYEEKIRQQRQEIESLLEEQETLQELKNKAAMSDLALKNERVLKLKVERAHLILENRLEELLNNKKNKYRCF